MTETKAEKPDGERGFRLPLPPSSAGAQVPPTQLSPSQAEGGMDAVALQPLLRKSDFWLEIQAYHTHTQTHTRARAIARVIAKFAKWK